MDFLHEGRIFPGDGGLGWAKLISTGLVHSKFLENPQFFICESFERGFLRIEPLQFVEMCVPALSCAIWSAKSRRDPAARIRLIGKGLGSSMALLSTAPAVPE